VTFARCLLTGGCHFVLSPRGSSALGMEIPLDVRPLAQERGHRLRILELPLTVIFVLVAPVNQICLAKGCNFAFHSMDNQQQTGRLDYVSFRVSACAARMKSASPESKGSKRRAQTSSASSSASPMANDVTDSALGSKRRRLVSERSWSQGSERRQ
jgi:hypothetical protein